MKTKKTILVTGATRGLGLDIATFLIQNGYRVIGTGRSESAPVSWPDLDDLVYQTLDLGEWPSHKDVVKQIVKAHGPLFGLVNNAAIGLDGVLATLHEKDIEDLVQVNVLGTIVLTKYVVRNFLINGQGGGRIVNISSIIASTGFNGLSVYGATKSAMAGFSRSLARELGKANITVNTVSPGYMETDMTAGIDTANLERIKKRSPLGCLVSPRDVAGVVEHLLSDAGKNITGIDIKVDAGSTI